MASLNDYIVELKLGKNVNLESIFNMALKQVFSAQYLSKIESVITKRVKLKEKVLNKPNVVAWVEGTTIYVNKPEFYSKDINSQVRYLLHEFMHVLMNSKSFFFLNKFKEVKSLSESLWKIVKKHSEDPGKFLTGTSQKKSMLNYQESLSYLMNDKINWTAISPIGAKLFRAEIISSGIFNAENKFWKRRLY